MKGDNINASKMKQYLNSGEALSLNFRIGRIALYDNHHYIEIENGNGNGRSYKKIKDHDFLVNAMYISYDWRRPCFL